MNSASKKTPPISSCLLINTTPDLKIHFTLSFENSRLIKYERKLKQTAANLLSFDLKEVLPFIGRKKERNV